MAPPEKPAKTMSSRLMNMKFMQRAHASSPSTSDRGNQRPQKRQKLADNSAGTPSGAASPASEQSTPKLNPEAERFLERQAELAGETKWTLPAELTIPILRSPSLRIVRVGFNEIDSLSREEDGDGSESDEPESSPRLQDLGRRRFGSFKNRPEEADPEPSEDYASSSEEVEDETSSRAGITPTKKRERAASKHDDMAVKKRKSGDVDLRKLTSISGTGGPPASSASVTCYLCGQRGHVQSACKMTKGKRGKVAGRGEHRKP